MKYKILLIKFRNIGDVLLSTPLIENLKHHFPDSAIDFAINKESIDMLSKNPLLNEIIVYDRKHIKALGFFKQAIAEINFIKRFRKNNYDIVINLTEGDKGAIIAYFSKSKLKMGFEVRAKLLKKLNIFDKIADDKLPQHTVYKDLQFITLLDKKIISKNVSIFWNKDIENNIDKILLDNKISNFVHIHPVSRWMFKCWEDDRTAQIIDYLQIEKNLKVVITGAPNIVENDRINKIITLCKTTPLNLSGKLNLKHLAYLSKKSKFFFGVDTAPMHIAAINTKVVALFGASEALKWAPWSNNCENIYTNNGIQDQYKHLVFAKNDYNIFYENNIKKCRGMIDITTKDILAKIHDFLYE